MVKWYNSIMTKLTVSFLILIVVISGMSFFYTYGETKTALKDTTQDELTSLASVIATQIDGDLLSTLKEGDENSPEFIKLRDQLYKIQESSDEILYVYTMRKIGDKVAYVVDAEYGIFDDDTSGINEIYETPSKEMFIGFDKPVSEKEFTYDEWGVVISGYAPVLNSKGETVGIVGIDMDSQKVIDRQNFIGNIIYIIILISVLIAGGFIAMFARSMIRDIHTLNATANKISMGDTGVNIDIKRNDEIGLLAESFGRMVASLKIMMMDPEDEDKQ
ncbi:HAMP domain-containing protein [Methanoplanus sp. FWC-SCC4]|uniref:histidine kinase n=1 Tax=Methanochimaera problematica TaxID=2609417 RepID=A0AA97I2U6_9EURY|nr:HAMP domain-containing protein [Methanoplanus sp. FWC-SCC4]WOF16665.1 HAMP domain-containing protein [Methanoplanus sp. FWC-SCC4]